MFELLKQMFLPPLQMGILGLGGKAGKSKTKGEEQFTRDKKVTTDQKKEAEQRRVGEEQTQLTEEQQTELLSSEVRTGIEQLVGQLGLDIGEGGSFATAGDIARLGQMLSARATEAEGAIRQETGAIIGAARQEGEDDIQRTMTALMQATGGGQGSLISQLGLEAGADLQTQLAGLEAELGIQARAAGTEEFAAAISALAGAPAAGATGVTALANLTNVLKGASATTRRTGETVVSSEDLLTILERLTGTEQTRETGRSTTRSDTKSRGGGFELNI